MADKNEAQRREMLEEPMGRLLFRKAYPTVIIQLITVVYNTADTYFVSQIDTAASAAVGVSFSLMSLIQALGFGIGMGASSLISRRLGEQKPEEANRFASSAVVFDVLVGLIISAAGLSVLRPLMRALGASETVLPYAVQYAFYILIAAPFMCASFALNSILRAEGQSFFSMIGLVVGGVLNIALDPLLINGFGLGIRGAAISTMICQIAGVLILLLFFLRGKSMVKLRPRFISRKGRDYLQMLWIGFPSVIRQGIASAAMALMNVTAAPYGDAAVAAMSISNKIYILVRHIVIGVGQGFQPIAGYCYGAKRNDRVRKVFWLSTVASTGICTVLAIAIFFARVPLMVWFRPDKDVVRIGARALCWFCAVTPLMAYSTYVNQLYQSLGYSFGAAILASCRQGIFFIPLILILPRFWGISGIEMTQSVSDFLTFAVSVPFQIVFFRRRLK